MANRELKTKIKLRYDLLDNWTEKNPELLAGEIAIVAIPSGVTEMQVDGSQPNPPQILFKVGPGKFNNLSYASAKAADVYGWAKAASKPTYTKEEVGLSNVLNVASYSKVEIDALLQGIGNRLDTVDTNTTYLFEKTDKGFKITSSEGEAQTISFEYLTEQEIKNLVEDYGYAGLEYVNGKLAEKVNISDYNAKVEEIVDDINELSGLVDEDIKEINESITGINNKFADYYTKTEADAEFIKEHQDISGKADKTYVDAELAKKVSVDSIGNYDFATNSSVNASLDLKVDKTVYEAKMESLDGSISSLNSNKVNNSDFEAYKTEANGKFLTKHQDISGKADITYVDSEIKKVDDAVKLLTNGAGTEEIDSVNELIDYVSKHGATVTGLQNDIKANADAIDVLEAKPAMGISSDDITNWNGIEGRVDNKLTGKVDLEGYIAYSQAEKEKLAGLENYDDSTVKGLISAEETRAKGVEEGLEGRISTLEDKPFDTYATKSEVEAVDTLVDGAIERIDAIEADYLKGEDKTALSNAINTEKGRIDTLVDETIPGINDTIETLATKAEVSEAITNSHTHSNKTILDATTASFTTELKTKYDGYESSINDFVNNTRGYATKSEVESVSNRVKAIEDDKTILRSTDVFIWDCGGAE